MTPPDRNTLSLTIESQGRSTPYTFPVRRLVNAGYVGRNLAAVQAHIDELRHEGIPPPRSIPAFFMLTGDSLTTADQIEVASGGTSGEVEYVLFQTEDDVLVGVGSDHTDRVLERTSLSKSKQICKNVVSQRVWRLADLKEAWDDLILESWVRSPETGQEILYQKGLLGTILPPEELIAMVRARIKDQWGAGLVIFSGTIPVVGGKLISSTEFRGELLDPRSSRALSCAYRVVPLDYLKDAGD
jgi:hypothetical protein